MYTNCFERGFGKRSDDSVSFEQGAEQAKKIIAREAISFDSLESKYGVQEIRKDKTYVANRKECFSQGKKIDAYGENCAKIFEAILHMRLKKQEWLDGIQAVKTNEFDDIAAGVDEAVRVFDSETKKEFCSFAVDAMITGGGPLNIAVEKKMRRIQEEILRNELPSVKYFFDPETESLGLKNLPRFVVGADMKTINELNEMWLEHQKEEMRNHPLQTEILEQLIEQAKEIGDFADRNGKHDIAKKYKDVQMWARKKLSEKTKNVANAFGDNATFVISNSLYPFRETKNFKALEN